MKKTQLCFRLILLAASAALLPACTSSTKTHSSFDASGKKRSKEYFSEAEYGVKASPRVTMRRSRLPRGGGREQVGRPYQIRGKWYYPREEPGYVKVGMASWYGDAFHGRLTANGEIYDMTHLTAAHPTMPLPSYARVTNMANGASVIVRVNDRGPYSHGRVIDMSHKAAEMLDYAQSGMARVKVEYVGRAPLDGRDDSYLLASYVPGNGAPDPSVGMPTGVMVAMNGASPDSGTAEAFPGQLTTSTEGGLAIAPDQQLPENGPAIMMRPGGDVAFASMSYGATPDHESAAAFASLMQDGSSGWKDRGTSGQEYVLVGSFESRGAAARLQRALRDMGTSSIKASTDTAGNRWYALMLTSDGSHSADSILEAAWAAGAADAMTVRD